MLPDAPFYFFFNGLLWILFCMNVWWSYFIILLIFRIIVGKSKSIEDTRELYVTEEQLLNSKKKDSLGRAGEANANGGEQKVAMTNGSFQNGVTQNGAAHKHQNGGKENFAPFLQLKVIEIEPNQDFKILSVKLSFVKRLGKILGLLGNLKARGESRTNPDCHTDEKGIGGLAPR